jgi:lysozyme
MQNYMSLGQNGLDLIKNFEGTRLESYQDSVGIWTIGTGSIRINGQPVQQGMIITEDQANQLLTEELNHFVEIINHVVQVDLTQNQFDALVSFTYNLGDGNLRKSTLLRKLNAGDYQGAADEFPKWDRAGGQVIAGLLRRRNAERDLFLS